MLLNAIDKLTTPVRSIVCRVKEFPCADAMCTGLAPLVSWVDMLTPLLASACIHASCPRIADMWAGVHPRGVTTVVSAPCHSNQCIHWQQICYSKALRSVIYFITIYNLVIVTINTSQTDSHTISYVSEQVLNFINVKNQTYCSNIAVSRQSCRPNNRW